MGRAFEDVVCLSHLRWGFVRQRPQHLLSRCARDSRVFFVEEPLETDGPARIEVSEREDGVFVVVPHIPSAGDAVTLQERLLRETLADHGVAAPVLWYYTPMALAFTRELADGAAAVVYDCMDELAAFAGAPPQLADLEAELLERADVVFTGGESLFEAKRDRHDNVHAFPTAWTSRTSRPPAT